MTDRAKLEELAVKVEQATGPLAEEIARTVIVEAWKLLNPMPSPWRVPRQANGEPWPGDGLGPYTPEATAWEAKRKVFQRLIDAGATLDAAMSLVPEGMPWSVTADSRAYGEVLRPQAHVLCEGSKFVSAATPALALTAAALRAQVSQGGGNA